MGAFGDTEEFEITCTAPDKETLVVTRGWLDHAKGCADSAIRQGYTKAVVINTYGGVRSDALYVAEVPHS